MTNTNERPAEDYKAKGYHSKSEMRRMETMKAAAEEGGRDLLMMVDAFIKKWCGDSAPHLLDSDENDGQRLREAISRTRKEAEEKAWRAAVEAVPFDEITRIDLKTDADQRKEGWNSAHQRLITAAKDSGVNLEV